ncbi:hypothetical protein QE152_g25572 [Popillia japonica]|uniref:Uncharacterized protein n=1 Tax=Popillia japonica TaxID=7064 RepID=A0AAW1K192_POPJA
MIVSVLVDFQVECIGSYKTSVVNFTKGFLLFLQVIHSFVNFTTAFFIFGCRRADSLGAELCVSLLSLTVDSCCSCKLFIKNMDEQRKEDKSPLTQAELEQIAENLFLDSDNDSTMNIEAKFANHVLKIMYES